MLHDMVRPNPCGTTGAKAEPPAEHRDEEAIDAAIDRQGRGPWRGGLCSPARVGVPWPGEVEETTLEGELSTPSCPKESRGLRRLAAQCLGVDSRPALSGRPTRAEGLRGGAGGREGRLARGTTDGIGDGTSMVSGKVLPLLPKVMVKYF